MNLLAPVSTIMNRDLHVVLPDDHIGHIKDIFDRKRIQHIPVVRHGRVVGIINKQNFRGFYEGLGKHVENKLMSQSLLRLHTAEEVMTKKIFTLETHDRVSLALEMLKENIFSALPVVDGEKLVGIVTSLDLMKTLAKDKVMEMDYRII
jgi:CBS domain-containing protein